VTGKPHRESFSSLPLEGAAGVSKWPRRFNPKCHAWECTMQTVQERDIEILRRLVTVGGDGSDVSSNHRIRLELLGVIKDGPRGIIVTDLGRQILRRWSETP
jgi:hypothetical protein